METTTDKTLFQQKHPEIMPYVNGNGTTFNKYDWAFNSEQTDPEILEQSKSVLNSPDATDEERATANYIVKRDSLKKQFQTEYKIGYITNAVNNGDENAELVGWLDLLGLTQPDESVEDSCRIHCGGRTPQETLKYFRDNFKGHIENGDEEAARFSAMTPEEKKTFIARLREDDLTVDSIEKVYGFGGASTDVPTKHIREMTDDEFDKWSNEYLNQTKYTKFWNMLQHSGERNVRLGLALSMTQDEASQKAFIPTLQSLSKSDRDEIYYIAHEFNPEISMWWLIKDDFVQSWADIPQAVENGFEWIRTTPVDLKQYVDSHGGLDKIMSDQKAKDEFRKRFFVHEGTIFFWGINRFELPFGSGDRFLRDYATRIYDMGKGALELRERYNEIQTAMQKKYTSKGYVVDNIIQGLSFGLQFGQFALLSTVSGGVGSLASLGARGANIAAKGQKAISLATRAKKLATIAKYADKGAQLGEYATKLTIPYFGAMMSVDAQEAAQKAGFTDEQSFVLGAGIGVVNSFLERIQFGIRSKNVFLGEKVVRAIENRKDILKTVTMQYCIDGIKNRGKHFGEEYLVENLQNVVQEVGLALGGKLTENEYKDAMSITEDLFAQAKDMIISLFVATNVGAGTGVGKAARTFAMAETFGKDIVAFHQFNAAVQTNEALRKLKEADLPKLNLDLAQKYLNAQTEEERSAILLRAQMNQKERSKAKNVLEDVKGNLQKVGESLIERAKARIKSTPDVILLDDKQATNVNHDANKAFISDFAKIYGIDNEIVYLNSINEAPVSYQKSIVDGGIPDGFTAGGKIYIIGDQAKTPKRTLEILKHEAGHRGAEGIRERTEYKTFLDNILNEYGGEEIVKAAIRSVKGNVYDKQGLDKYGIAEEFMCMLAEKVAAKNELTKEELSTWAKIKDFFVELLSGIPQNEVAKDRYIANIIRAVWAKEYLNTVSDNDAFDFSDKPEEKKENKKLKIPESIAKERVQKAKHSFDLKVRKRKLLEKKMSDEEREFELEKIQALESFYSIPEDDIGAKLELISSLDEDLLADNMLEWAAENGEDWAGDLLQSRIQEKEKGELNNEGDSLLIIMSDNGYKLPTPKAIIADCKKKGLPLSGTLFGEINDLYNSLNFYQQQKYFTKNYVDIDDLANVLRSEHNLPYEGSADFLSDFADNISGQKETRFSYSDIPAPTAAEIKEVERQIKEVKAKWTNPDGTMKKGYLCAPNGKPSKLTEEQWLLVRTPNFKKWFGDWEAFAEKDVLLGLNAINLERIDLTQFAIDEKRPVNARGVVAYLKEKYKDDVKNGVLSFTENPLGAPIEVGRYATSGFAGKNAGNAEAFLSLLNIKSILKDSVVINSETNWKNRGYDSAILANKIKIGDEEYISTVVVERIPQSNNKYKNRGYVVDAISIARLNKGTVLQFNARVGDKAPFDTNNTVLMRNVLQNIWNVNKKDVSRVVDENGEPLVVYHGTGADVFNVADATGKHFKNGEGAQAHGKGLYLALAKSTAENYRDAARDRPVDFDKVENDYGITPELLGVSRKDFDEIVTLFSEMGADETIEYYFNNKLKPIAEKLKAIIDDKGISTEDFRPTGRGKVFEWFTNLKKNEIFYEDKRLSKQPAKVKKAVIEIMKEAGLERFTGEGALYGLYGRDLYNQLGSYGRNLERELLKRGIRGIAYEGWNDGKCIVSFEGGSAVKLQDPFTFDDNGQLIPLSQRFDEGNPDMRFSFATLEKLKNAKPVEVGIDDHKGKYELNAKSAFKYVMDNLRKKPYHIADTDEYVKISQVGAKEITSHDRYNEVYLKTFVAIPDMIKNAIYLGERPNEKNNGKWDKYRYYACGLKIDGTDYTAMLTIGVKGDKKYYDQYLVKIEKGLLIDNIDRLTSLFDADGNPVDKINNRLISLLQENKSEETKFSYPDNPIHQKKRELAVKLAKDMYKRLGKDFNAKNPNARKEVAPTEEERQNIYMEDLSFLEDDVDDICNRATAIFWRMVNGGYSKKELTRDFDRLAINEERSFEYSHIIEACVKDALKDYKKELNLSAKIKAQEQRDLQKEVDSVKGFTTDELAIYDIDLMSAVENIFLNEIGEFIPDTKAINEQIDKIVSRCKDWANAEGVSYDLQFAKIRATLVEAFNDISDKLVYGKHVKSACEAIFALSEIENEKMFVEKAKKLGTKLSEFFCKVAKEFELNEEAKAQKKAKAAQNAEAKVKKEAEAKAQKRSEKIRANAIKRFKTFAQSKKLPKNNELEIKRKIPARIQAYLAQIKKVILLSSEQVEERFNYLNNKKGSLESDGAELNYKESYELSALIHFGNIEGKTLPEILGAYDELVKIIKGAKDAQAKKLDDWEAEIAKMTEPLCDALRCEGNKESVKDGLFASGAEKNVSMLEHRLRNIFLARKGLSNERSQEIEKWITDYSKAVGRASIFERNMANAEMEWLHSELERIYGDANVGFERLTKVNKEWSKFASDGERDMSLGQIMQILCSLEQHQVREAWEQAQKRKAAQEKNPDVELNDKFEREYRYWKKLFDSQEEMKSLLDENDSKFISSLKRRYRVRLETINPVYERLNGLPMLSNGANYMPIVRLGEFDIENVGLSNKITLFPSYYMPRTISLRPLEESVNILQVFSQRTQTDAHFVNFADIIFETKELLRNYDFSTLLRSNLTKGEQQGFADMIRDTLNGKIRRDNTADGKIASAISNLTAYFGLAFNLVSAIKQPTSFPAYLLHVPTKDYFGGLKELLSSGEIFASIREVWDSPYMKDRRNNGEINQILADFSRAEKECKNENKSKRWLRRMWGKYAFMPTKYADNFAFVLGGTSVYYHFLKQYREIYSEEEAKKLAMTDMMNIGEMTQQSAFIMNMSEGQRQGAGFGRMFSTFRTTNQQYLSYELNAIREVVKNPNARNCARLAKILLLNHVILPSMFNGAGLLMNLAMGDDWDDDDVDYLIKTTAISSALDVFTGWWFGAILKGSAEVFFLGGNKNLTDSMLPASTVSRVMSSVLDTAKDVYKNGFTEAEWFEHLDKIGKSTFSPYRIVRKIYNNATDGKKGEWW